MSYILSILPLLLMSATDMLYFYAELGNDTESDDDTVVGEESCMITQTPLCIDHVTLVCGHKFNYDAIFNDVYNHKKQFHELETSRLKDTQIRCPYCRNIQNSLLPCPPGKKRVCGVNIVVDIYYDKSVHMRTPSMFWYNYKQYARGYCCHGVNDINGLATSSAEVTCSDMMVMYNDVDERVYCKAHLKQSLTGIFLSNVAAAKKEIAREKREVAAIVRQEKALAKKKAGLVEKQDICQKTIMELQSWHSSKMFLAKTSTTGPSVPENVVVSSSIAISTATHAPAAGSSVASEFEKPVSRCLAITIRNKTRCASKAVKGSTYCSRHKSLGGSC